MTVGETEHKVEDKGISFNLTSVLLDSPAVSRPYAR